MTPTIVTITAFQDAERPPEEQETWTLGWAHDLDEARRMLVDQDITHGRPGHFRHVALEEVDAGLFPMTGRQVWLEWNGGRWRERAAPARYDGTVNIGLG